MTWNSDSENEELNDKPYSALSEDPQRFLTQPKYPFVLLGAGVLLLIVLVAVFFVRNPEPTDKAGSATEAAAPDTNRPEADMAGRLKRIEAKITDLMAIQKRMDGLESRIIDIENKYRSAREGKTAPEPESTHQIQANLRSIKDTTQRLNLIEQRLNRLEDRIQQASAAGTDRQTAGPSSPETVVYVVKKGDTPYGIAKKHDVELKRLFNLNGLKDGAKIYPGQELKIPKH